MISVWSTFFPFMQKASLCLNSVDELLRGKSRYILRRIAQQPWEMRHFSHHEVIRGSSQISNVCVCEDVNFSRNWKVLGTYVPWWLAPTYIPELPSFFCRDRTAVMLQPVNFLGANYDFFLSTSCYMCSWVVSWVFVKSNVFIKLGKIKKKYTYFFYGQIKLLLVPFKYLPSSLFKFFGSCYSTYDPAIAPRWWRRSANVITSLVQEQDL